MKLKERYAYAILSVASLIILYLFLSDRFLHPNDYMYVVGGDGLFIYYNLLFHTCHGSGVELTAMNYPWNEYIFMTDAQASLAVVLSYLNDRGLPTCKYGVGLMHIFIYALIPVCSILIYKILRRIQIPQYMAMVGALLICFMSPQIARMNVHFSLAYPFILPLCLDWYLHYKQDYKLDVYALILFVCLLFFGLNNPYIGFISCGFLACCFLFDGLLKKRFSRTDLIGFVIIVAPLILLYIILRGGDSFNDRVVMQWGYFYYNAHPGGLFLGEGSLFRRWFEGVCELPSIIFESRMNIGVVSFFTISLSAVVLLFNKQLRSLTHKELGLLFSPILACVSLYIYADNFLIGQYYQDFIEDKLGILTMFKSAARFMWPTYLLLCICSVYFISKAYFFLKEKHSYLALVFVLAITSIWTAEAGQYVRHRFKTNIYKNVFLSKEKPFQELVSKNRINDLDFQAMYILPKMQGWNDKLFVDLDFTSHHNGAILSWVTGIPLINAMLSRVSVSQSIMSEQFSSHPIIDKELLPFLDPDRPVLLLVSEKSSLDIGSKYLVSKAKFIDKYKNSFSLYSLSIESLKAKNEYQEVAIEKYATIDSIHNRQYYYQNRFNNGVELPNRISGNACLVDRGINEWLVIDDLSGFSQKELELSFWTYVDHKKYGLPEFSIDYLDEKGTVLKNDFFWIRSQADFYEEWIRSSRIIKLTENVKSLSIKTKTNQKHLIDEVLLRSVGDTIITKGSDDSYFMFNNYPVNIKQ